VSEECEDSGVMDAVNPPSTANANPSVGYNGLLRTRVAPIMTSAAMATGSGHGRSPSGVA